MANGKPPYFPVTCRKIRIHFSKRLIQTLKPCRPTSTSSVSVRRLIEETDSGVKLSLPHIRLDRALEYLLGDRLA
jgi:predicted YcjX-like family ATPase